MYVKPAPGLAFRDPRTGRRVPLEGIEVPDHDLEWVRLIRSGDAVEVEPPVAVVPAPVEAADAPAGAEAHTGDVH